MPWPSCQLQCIICQCDGLFLHLNIYLDTGKLKCVFDRCHQIFRNASNCSSKASHTNNAMTRSVYHRASLRMALINLFQDSNLHPTSWIVPKLLECQSLGRPTHPNHEIAESMYRMELIGCIFSTDREDFSTWNVGVWAIQPARCKENDRFSNPSFLLNIRSMQPFFFRSKRLSSSKGFKANSIHNISRAITESKYHVWWFVVTYQDLCKA